VTPRPHGWCLAVPALLLAAACAHPPPPAPPPAPPPDPALVAGAQRTLEEALATRNAAKVTRLFDPALVGARSWTTEIVPRAVDPVEVKLIPAAVEGDQVVARLRLQTARLRGTEAVTQFDGLVAVTPDPDTTWRFGQPTPAILQRLRVDTWKQDIAFVRAELPRRHVNAFQEIRRQQFLGALAALEGALPRLEDHQVQVGLMTAVASLGDPHTRLRTSFQAVGIELEWFEDGLFVTRAARPHTDLARTRLLRVGTFSVEQAAARVRSVFATDNDSGLLYLAPWYLAQPEVLHAVGLARRPEAAFYAFQRPDGHEINLELALPDPGKTLRWPERRAPTLRERQPERPFWFQRLTRGKALYLKYNHCQDPEAFREMTDKLLAVLDRGGIERVVIDLRDNEGGDSAVAEPLLLGLAQRQASRSNSKRLQILGLIGRRTFSSGMWTAIHLRKRLGAALVGEPTSGKPNSPGEVQSVKLPVSGLELQYSTKNWVRDPDANLPSLMPDLPVAGKAADYFAGRDVVLDAALGQPRTPTPPSPAAAVSTATAFR
jgi:hypothetical protein